MIMGAINESYGSGASIEMSLKPWRKDKGGQRAIGWLRGRAMIAGPAGAAIGGMV
jgi:hypothetical protein